MGVGLRTAGSAVPYKFALAAQCSDFVGDLVFAGVDASLDMFERRNEDENFG